MSNILNGTATIATPQGAMEGLGLYKTDNGGYQLRHTHYVCCYSVHMGTGKFQAASYLTAMANGCPLVVINLPIIGASVSEPHIDSTAGTFHILWYDRHQITTVIRAP